MSIKYVKTLPPSLEKTLRETPVPWGPLGWVTYRRTYSRKKTPGGGLENWGDTICRGLQGLLDYGMAVTEEELTKMAEHWHQLRLMPAGRGLWQLGTSTVSRNGSASLNNCLAGETKVLTRQGWKQLKDLAGTEVELVTRGGKWVKAPVRCFGKQKLRKITCQDGTVYHATDNHRWFVRRGKDPFQEMTTKDLKGGDYFPLVRPKNVVQYMSPQGVCHGLTFGDGTKTTNDANLTLCGKKKELARYFPENRSSVTEDEHVNIRGLPWGYKELPGLDRENKPYLMGFLAGWFAADGHVSPVGQMTLFNKDRAVLEYVKDLASVLGFRTGKISQIADTNPYNGEPREMWKIAFSNADEPERLLIRADQKERARAAKRPAKDVVRVARVEETDRYEDVYCATVPEEAAFVIEGNVLTGNCYFVPLNCIESFCFLFDMLMMGGGVGFSVMPNEVFKLPTVKAGVQVVRKDIADVDFIVPDNREGWVELLRKTLTAFFVTGRSFSYSCQAIRSKGAPIQGFGGVASGPEDLAKGVWQISNVLMSRAGKSLRPIDALDICNIVGSVVVAGNIRRSAELCLGYSQDAAYLGAKNWGKGNIPNWRAMSNNTVAADDMGELPDAFWGGYTGEGEPYGLFNLALARKVGRLIDKGKYPDPTVDGINPCAEQTLAAWECCCLVENVLPNIRDAAQFHEVAVMNYRIAKTIISLRNHWPQAQAIVEENRRIGIGITGICQQTRFGPQDYDAVYRHLREEDLRYSRLIGIRPSVKLTTVKPSGTVSLLPGVTPGVHPAYAPYYIRRIRMASEDPLLGICRSHGYHVEPVVQFDGSHDAGTSVVSFPVKSPRQATYAAQMTAVDQLELQKKIQTYWSDNAVSITCYYRKEELPAIKDWLQKNYKDGVKTVSCLLHQEHGFKQAPYEEITKEEYQQYASKVTPITGAGDDLLDLDSQERTLADSQECASGACPIR